MIFVQNRKIRRMRKLNCNRLQVQKHACFKMSLWSIRKIGPFETNPRNCQEVPLLFLQK